MRESEKGVALAWAQATDLPAVLTLLEACALRTEGVDAVLSTLLVAYETQVAEEHAVRPFGSISVISFRTKKGRGKSDGHND